MTLDSGVLLAALSIAFSAGLAIAAIRGKASKTQLLKAHNLAAQALRVARRAHTRLDELEAETGTRTALRPDYGDREE